MIGKLVYVLAILDRKGRVKDIGPEIFESEESAWASADAHNKRRQFSREYGCQEVDDDFEVIKRRLVP